MKQYLKNVDCTSGTKVLRTKARMLKYHKFRQEIQPIKVKSCYFHATVVHEFNNIYVT